jgi:hypothetical protein
VGSEIADMLLAAARKLRLRRFMGSLPFNMDAWMDKGPECDLPRLKAGETRYYFEVRDINYSVGTSFKLWADNHGRPWLEGGDPNHRESYPADLDGWRAVDAETGNTSLVNEVIRRLANET